MAIVPALIAGGLSYLGSRQSAKMSQASAREQMAFQASQTGTGYQRAMEDMRKAGLNPMLAAKLGPAASGSGAMAQIPDFGQAISRGASSAQAVASAKQAEAQTSLIELQQATEALKPAEIEQRIQKIAAETKNVQAAEALTRLNTREKALVVATHEALYAKDPGAYAAYTAPMGRLLASGAMGTESIPEFLKKLEDVGKAGMKSIDESVRNASKIVVEFVKEIGE